MCYLNIRLQFQDPRATTYHARPKPPQPMNRTNVNKAKRNAHTTPHLMKTATVWHRAASLAAIAFVVSGCSGINASKSISPLDFLLPGLMQNVPSPPVMPTATNPLPGLAQTHHGQPSMLSQPNCA
jgi:hypothetical protein